MKGAWRDFSADMLLVLASRVGLQPTLKLAAIPKAAQTIEFLRSPPGNRLEALKDDRKVQFSIRINDQHRLCFRWTNEGPTDVEIVDYH
jgi:plasmid maintenance system killer protein